MFLLRISVAAVVAVAVDAAVAVVAAVVAVVAAVVAAAVTTITTTATTAAAAVASWTRTARYCGQILVTFVTTTIIAQKQDSIKNETTATIHNNGNSTINPSLSIAEHLHDCVSFSADPTMPAVVFGAIAVVVVVVVVVVAVVVGVVVAVVVVVVVVAVVAVAVVACWPDHACPT